MNNSAEDVFWPILIIVLLFVGVIYLGFYIYRSMAWMAIAKKLGYDKPWLAWVPFGRTIMRLQLGEFHWSLVFLFLLPIFYIVFLVISSINYNIFNNGSNNYFIRSNSYSGISNFLAWPILIILVIATMRIYRKRGYSGWLASFPLFEMALNLIVWIAALIMLDSFRDNNFPVMMDRPYNSYYGSYYIISTMINFIIIGLAIADFVVLGVVAWKDKYSNVMPGSPMIMIPTPPSEIMPPTESL